MPNRQLMKLELKTLEEYLYGQIPVFSYSAEHRLALDNEEDCQI